MKQIAVAGIGTGIGKTVVSAILTEALQADYWKPVQAGNLDYTDTDFVREHIGNAVSRFHPEAYRLEAPMSPHAAAALEGIDIRLDRLALPVTPRTLVAELAGGVMVPLSNTRLNIDLLQSWSAAVVLVSQNYLGSINHTLLSVAALQSRNIPIAGIVFNGEPNAASEDLILRYTQLPCLLRVLPEKQMNRAVIQHYADALTAQHILVP